MITDPQIHFIEQTIESLARLASDKKTRIKIFDTGQPIQYADAISHLFTEQYTLELFCLFFFFIDVLGCICELYV